MKERFRKFFIKSASYELDGVGVVEIILILVILIGLVLIFKEGITDIITKAFSSITGNTAKIIP